jgi:hypothetical protein
MQARPILRYPIFIVVHISPIRHREPRSSWPDMDKDVHTECETRSSCPDMARDVLTVGHIPRSSWPDMDGDVHTECVTRIAAL